MGRRILALALVVVVLLGLSGCVVRRVDSGEVRTEPRSVTGFDSVEFAGFGSLEVEQGDAYELELTGVSSLLDRVETEVRGDTLYIRHKTRWTLWSWGGAAQRLDVRLVVPELTRLTVSGAGEVDIDGLQGEDFRFELSGAGEFTASDIDVGEMTLVLSGASSARVTGTVEGQDVTMSGAGEYDARDLQSRRARLELSGASSATVWVEESLDVETSGAASVDYYGEPDVRSDISGVGTVTRRGSK